MNQEKEGYHKDVHVGFSPGALFDDDVACDWVGNVVAPYIDEYMSEGEQWLLALNHHATHKTKVRAQYRRIPWHHCVWPTV